MATNSSLTQLQLTHNVLRDLGAAKIQQALHNNWALLKLATEGNNFDSKIRIGIVDLIKRNQKMNTLTRMQDHNAREFERIKDRVQPPPWETGHGPVRFAHEIDISRTDPRMYAALEKAATLTQTAKAKGHIDSILADRALAVVEAAAGSSNRAIMALSLCLPMPPPSPRAPLSVLAG